MTEPTRSINSWPAVVTLGLVARQVKFLPGFSVSLVLSATGLRGPEGRCVRIKQA
ncbi:hypothetical protein AB0C34_30835 [Nocardia sp. NPDC049220]|uniref:hypothetical protein n=1 Tax=Nocardia sp. NPDC049220 TaxID=3155273 RepID=UPI0033ECFB09